MAEHIYIESAFSFLDQIYQQFNFAHSIGLSEYVQYYRGQTNKEYGLAPSLDREDCRLNGTYEKRIIQEFVARRPEAFAGINNMFNLVSKMQHYGLVTRLLDLTKNPAVALYFACYDKNLKDNEKDGEIFIFNTNKNCISSSKGADAIMRFYIYGIDDKGNYSLSKYYDKIKKDYSGKELLNIIDTIMMKYPKIVLTDLISERMKRQQSIFAIVPNISNNSHMKEYIERSNEVKQVYDYIEEYGLETTVQNTEVTNRVSDCKTEIIKNCQDNKRYIIKAEFKPLILRQLDSIGINEAFLFPELHYEGRHIVKEFKRIAKQHATYIPPN